ncbi:preprotein translocase subunit YajC [Rothia sp. ZJ932]|uniref:preprotein translocase subunit YajC n=1 Tax=Rothia sp. ZJ932 TaxID=2810516 RepID=UPI001966EEA7|nr:preprotein translocase subunit YajC [Rothia sp. ZJ932]QRZ62454.1 preprotein translocase subunit YajC [Rothia sp. ZJ932]
MNSGSSSSAVFYILMLVLMVVFLFILPARRAKALRAQIQQMHDSLQAGTQIVTVAGIFGVIQEVNRDSQFALVEIAPGTVVKIRLAAIAEIVETGAPHVQSAVQISSEQPASAVEYPASGASESSRVADNERPQQ